jgi:hypothetical protein
MLVDVQLPLEPFNSMVKKGVAGKKLEEVLAEIKPEAVYFTNRDGKRGATIIVDVPEPSAVPSIAEPFFLLFEAEVEFDVVLGPEDLAKAGLDELGKKYS